MAESGRRILPSDAASNEERMRRFNSEKTFITCGRTVKMLRCFAPAKLAAGLLLLQLVSSTFAQSAPPVAPVREVTDEYYFGTKVVDAYRWMEDSKSPEMVAWMKGQSDYTRAYLDRLLMRQELLERITKLSDAGVAVTRVQDRGNLFFYSRLAPGENDRRLYVRDGLDGPRNVCWLIRKSFPRPANVIR
jgi:hypothetical protein